jgi:hypothetical protein
MTVKRSSWTGTLSINTQTNQFIGIYMIESVPDASGLVELGDLSHKGLQSKVHTNEVCDPWRFLLSQDLQNKYWVISFT